ncbi:MAG: hypothetical protein JO328_21330 [Hyphomicrobiales bacterium]|nr:hypothetical protein [Hyphomicrobiales bacterium]MBV9429109.1 hypothetical protein [Bradyrhizobiaceae bacterium]
MPVGIVGLAQTAVAALVGEPVTESRWHQPFSEPVRSKIAPQLAVALIASGLAYVEAPPFAERVTEDRWHQPWSEPVRTRWLPPAQQQGLVPDPQPRVSFSWWNWLSEPVRTRWLPAAEQQVSPFDEDVIWADRWFAWWSEPVVKARPRLAEASQQWLAFAPPFSAGAVQSEWAGPAPSLVRFQYQAFARAPAAPELLTLPGGGGGYLPDQTTDDRAQRTDDHVVRHPSSVIRPRQVEPAQRPPTFAAVIAAQQPAQLADVLGSRFAPALSTLTPPALDLWQPSFAQRAAPGKPQPVSTAAIDDIQDRLDAMEALRVLDETEQERKAQIVAMLLRIANSE